MNIRKTRPEELEEILSIYDNARQFMIRSGNHTQWGDSRPSRAVLERDIRRGDSYVLEEGGRIAGVFALIFGEDPTYGKIEGAWLTQRPYATIHRLASAGWMPGVGDACLAWSLARAAAIRIDTHRDNLPMRRLLAKHGFHYCGVIYVDDGTPRLAFESPADTAG